MLLLDYSLPNHLKGLSFESKNIRSFQPQDASAQHDRTTTRYHYTSASALMAILGANNNNGAVRFTDARYMNDRSEHMYFVMLLLEYMEEHRLEYQYCQQVINKLLFEEQPYSLDDYLSLCVPELKDTKMGNYIYKKSRNFLFCLCKNSDSLHMWNYYIHSGNYQGYNLGIKTYSFLKNFDTTSIEENDPIRFYCGDVLYTDRKQKREIEVLCKTIERFGERAGNYPDTLQWAAAYLWQYIECCGLFYKDKSFEDEEEYRIVIQFEGILVGSNISTYFKDVNRGIKYSFFERNGILVPYLSVPLAKEAVTQITMAPIMENRIATLSMEEFLDANGYSEVDVMQSTIPIRF